MTRTLFTNGRIFDGTGAPLADGQLVVEDGLIREVGPGLDGDEAVDLGGRGLLPGLFDCHVHVAVTDVDVWRQAAKPVLPGVLRDGAQPPGDARHGGITTVRDAGGADLGIKTAVEHGLIAGPRLQIALTMISQTGGHGDDWMASGADRPLCPTHPGRPARIVDGPDEMRRKVRELIRGGRRRHQGGHLGRGALAPRRPPPRPLPRTTSSRCWWRRPTAAGRWVMAHAQATDGIKNAVRAGIRSIEHGIYLDDEAIELMLRAGHLPGAHPGRPDGVIKAAEAGAAIPEASVRKAREVMEIHRDSFRRAVAAGVKVAMGTDSGSPRTARNLEELALMAAGGMTPCAGAPGDHPDRRRADGDGDRLGTIEPGKRADLVVVDGDPFVPGGDGTGWPRYTRRAGWWPGGGECRLPGPPLAFRWACH